MDLTEQEMGWRLTSSDARLTLIQIDHRLTLIVSNCMRVTTVIEVPFLMRNANGNLLGKLQPGAAATLSPILDLFNLRVFTIEARKNGELKMEFENGHTIEAKPHQSFEAWQISSDDWMLVCMPEGTVALFDGANPNRV